MNILMVWISGDVMTPSSGRMFSLLNTLSDRQQREGDTNTYIQAETTCAVSL